MHARERVLEMLFFLFFSIFSYQTPLFFFSATLLKISEEMVYAELYKRDIKKKELDEQKRIQAYKEKEQERNKILGVQYVHFWTS